ncbi:hypothetical protein UY3_07681 [Chelonia mydas]|uniref:Uncharacterized protein n=1 Tax=Chelonia mydas TaxID=8469 RepID=M7BHP6_CHEMY|nr:hypothetical protein UY3_07681 [Chelonia mydas]
MGDFLPSTPHGVDPAVTRPKVLLPQNGSTFHYAHCEIWIGMDAAASTMSAGYRLIVDTQTDKWEMNSHECTSELWIFTGKRQ